MAIVLLSKDEIAAMRKAGRAAADLLWYLAEMIKPGTPTEALDTAAVQWTKARNYLNGPLGYGSPPFPKSICTSINEVICHGIPSARILKEGDIINVDVSPIVDGWYGDTSRTFCVGRVSPTAKKLVDVTEECLRRGIAAVKPGGRIGDIGKAIQAHASEHGFSVVRDFVGHGVGRKFHTEPQIPHYYRERGIRFEPGMVFTIEPMINEGAWQAKLLDDEWTAVTADGKLSAQFEHTVAVTEDGVEILTLREGSTF